MREKQSCLKEEKAESGRTRIPIDVRMLTEEKSFGSYKQEKNNISENNKKKARSICLGPSFSVYVILKLQHLALFLYV